jgi:triphosphatase
MRYDRSTIPRGRFGLKDMTQQRDREIEVKFSCEPATLAQVLKAKTLSGAELRPPLELHAIYYDTSDLRLRNAQCVLRIRTTDQKQPLLCLKSMAPEGSGIFHRLEAEVPAPGGQADVSLFDAETKARLAKLIGKRALAAQFEIRVRRQILLLTHAGAQIEVSADEGQVIAGAKTNPITELELELKAGEEAGLYDLAILLAQEFPLSLNFVTKSERGFQLIGKSESAAVMATDLSLTPSLPMEDVIHASLSHGLYHFTSNWPALIEDPSPEAVHQLRAALRRLRILLKVFARACSCPEFADLRKQGKAIGLVLGKARSLDVLAETMTRVSKTGKISAKQLKALTRTLAQRQAVARHEAFDLIKGPAASRFVLQFQAALAKQPWRRKDQAGEPPAEPLRPEVFVAETLDFLHRRALRRGRGFAMLSDQELHGLRLALKALSQAALAFEDIAGHSKRATRFLSSLLRLQQGLGELNDDVFALTFCKDVAASEHLDIGALTKSLNRGMDRQREKLRTHWKAFKRLRPYWDQP